MNQTLIFSLMLFLIVLPVALLIFYALFKKTVTLLISFSTATNVAIIAFLAYIIGYYGLINIVAPLSVLFLAITYYYINLRVGKPLKDLSKNIEEISKGNLNTVINNDYFKQNNELGIISNSLFNMAKQLKTIFKEVNSSSSMLVDVSEELSNNAQDMSQISSE